MAGRTSLTTPAVRPEANFGLLCPNPLKLSGPLRVLEFPRANSKTENLPRCTNEKPFWIVPMYASELIQFGA